MTGAQLSRFAWCVAATSSLSMFAHLNLKGHLKRNLISAHVLGSVSQALASFIEDCADEALAEDAIATLAALLPPAEVRTIWKRSFKL